MTNEEEAPGFDFLAKDKARQVANALDLIADRYRYAAGQLERAAKEVRLNNEREDANDFLRSILQYCMNAAVPHTSVDNTEALIELLHLALGSATYAEKSRKEVKKSG